jgi:hypothetical protein
VALFDFSGEKQSHYLQISLYPKFFGYFLNFSPNQPNVSLDDKELTMNKRFFVFSFLFVIGTLFLTACGGGIQPTPVGDGSWQEDFDIADCKMVSTGSNPFFILEPGFEIVLESRTEKVIITVLDETELVDGIETRVVEEKEWKNGDLKETSRNFFAICEDTNDVYYFGEEVDMFSNGVLTSHGGQWLAGVDGARAGLIMPGEPNIGRKYYQEIAPGVALDRAEVISLDTVLVTPAGRFTNCLKTQEGTALNLLEKEFKTYAPGIGLIQDQNLLLTSYGFVDN